jgi:phosphinothricin acetyltransferase
MQVRLAHAGDAEAIRHIYNAEVTESTVTFDLEPRTARAQRAWVARHQGVHPALVAVEDPEVCGFGSLSPFHDRAAYATTVEDSVYVEGDWRGLGVGRLLLEELVRLATDQGFHTVIARTTTGPADSLSWASSVKSAANSVGGSTLPSSSGCFERRPEPIRPA